MIGFGERIKERRWQMGFTQKDLADKLGITGSAISSYENNTRLPSFEILIKMSRVFHMTTDELLGCAERDKAMCIDITGLSEQQKKNVMQMVETYYSLNELQMDADGRSK